MPVNMLEPDALILLEQRFGFFGIAFCAADLIVRLGLRSRYSP
jgi:hypothetical protein